MNWNHFLAYDLSTAASVIQFTYAQVVQLYRPVGEIVLDQDSYFTLWALPMIKIQIPYAYSI